MTQYLIPTPKELGDLIRGYRKQRTWTQAQLAEQAGLLPKTISSIETGKGQVLLANVMRCLSALEVDLYLASRPRIQAQPEPEPLAVKPPRPAVAKVRPTRTKRRDSAQATAAPPRAPRRTGQQNAEQNGKPSQSTDSRRRAAATKTSKERW